MLEEFYVMFKEDGFDAMTKGVEYLVTFNGCHRGSYRGRDDNGTAFCYSDDVFYAPMSTMIIPIDPPAGNIDYTHMGNYKGPKGHRFTTGGNYNLIYECGTDSVSARNDVGVWQQVSGEYFDVTHDYSQGGGIPNKPSAHNSAPCGGKNRTATSIVQDMAEGAEIKFDDGDASWAADEDVVPNGRTAPRIEHEPASTEDLRQYRFKPDLF